MGEPARKLSDIEPDIRPNLRVLQGGGKTTPDRASLKVLNGLESNPEQSNKGSLADQENKGSNISQGSWANKVAGVAKTAMDLKKGKINLKGKGPASAIGLSVGLCIFVLFVLLAPSNLLVNLKEILVEKFNTQLTSMDIRTTKILVSKMNTTSGICGMNVSIKCKYSTMSEKQVSNFEKAGIHVEVDPDDATTALKRVKVKGLTYDNKTILPNGLKSELAKDPGFRSAIKAAYNPKYAGFSDYIWKKVEIKLNINKKAVTFEGDNFNDKLNNLSDEIQDTSKVKKASPLKEGAENPKTGEAYSDAELKEINESIENMNELIDLSGGDGSVTSSVMNGADEVANTLKITGVADDVCTAYRTFAAIGYAAKTVRTIQLASYAMLFLNVADQIKAGVANPDDVSFLGTILTTKTTDENGVAKSATDSDGYLYAAYNDYSFNSISAMQYMAAAGLSGAMANFFESWPSAAKTTCAVLANPIVGFGSLIAGVAVMVFSGGTSVEAKLSLDAAKASLKLAAKEALTSKGFWLSTGLAFAEIFLPGLLKDTIAGTVINNSTVGEYAGDAIVSGSSVIMSTSAKLGGNSPLTPTQAVAYTELSNNVASEYAEEDQLAYSPFDITNSNTFMGKIAATIIPYISNISSVSNTFSSVSSIISTSFASIFSPITNATSTDEYSTCQDSEYQSLGVATDPFCNIIYGIPTEYLSIDPIDVAQYLEGQYDEETGQPIEGKGYANFINNCINRSDPLGYDSGTGSTGKECLIDSNPDNKYYYLFYIDQRVLTGMEAE